MMENGVSWQETLGVFCRGIQKENDPVLLMVALRLVLETKMAIVGISSDFWIQSDVFSVES